MNAPDFDKIISGLFQSLLVCTAIMLTFWGLLNLLA
jgi:hypothetical protein